MSQLWFKVSLCEDCWYRVMDRPPVRLTNVAPERCVKCLELTTTPICVRVGFPTPLSTEAETVGYHPQFDIDKYDQRIEEIELRDQGYDPDLDF